jgi:uncharacterized protein YhaN
MTQPVHALPEAYGRETADSGTSAATATRTFTEGEAYALVADNVQRETAALTGKVDGLTREVADLKGKLDVADAAVATEKAARETAEQALVDYKQSIETEKAQEARKAERTAKVREVASHLKDEFFTPERATRWAAMDDDAFASYVAELAELAPTPAKATTTTEPPRETAMAGSAVQGDAGKPKGLAGLSGFYPTAKGGN